MKSHSRQGRSPFPGYRGGGQSFNRDKNMSAITIAKELFIAVAASPTPWRLCRGCGRVWSTEAPGHVHAELPPECDGVVKPEQCVECDERERP